MQNKSSLFSASRLFMIFPILAFASHSLPYSWRFCGGALVSVSWRTARFSIALPLSVPLLPSPRLECFYPHGESLCIPQNHTHMLPSIGSLSWALSQNELLASLYFLDSFFLYLFTTRHNLSSLSSQGSALRPRPYSQACNRAGALDDDAPPSPAVFPGSQVWLCLFRPPDGALLIFVSRDPQGGLNAGRRVNTAERSVK